VRDVAKMMPLPPGDLTVAAAFSEWKESILARTQVHIVAEVADVAERCGDHHSGSVLLPGARVGATEVTREFERIAELRQLPAALAAPGHVLAHGDRVVGTARCATVCFPIVCGKLWSMCAVVAGCGVFGGSGDVRLVRVRLCVCARVCLCGSV
jgi:hypothetical protein